MKSESYTWGFGKIVAALGLTGALIGAAGSFALPERYVSQAALRYQHADRTDPVLSGALYRALDRQRLEEIIQRNNLYERERSQKPMADVLPDMRHAIRIGYRDDDKIDIDSFENS